MKSQQAEVVREYGPFPDATEVHGVTFDGRHVWFASGDKLNAIVPQTGEMVRSLATQADAGTAFDGKHLFQIAGDRILKIDPSSGRVLASIATPGKAGESSGMAWAEGRLWVGQYRDRKLYQIDPDTGDILSTIESQQVVTGVTWTNGELWHGTWEGDHSDLRRIDPATGDTLMTLDMPAGTGVSGLEASGDGQLFCGGGGSGMLRVVRLPK